MAFSDSDPSPAVAQERLLHTFQNGGEGLSVTLAGSQDGRVERVACEFHRLQ
ncbi:hypothetical protein nbrc107697_13030 [Gordonia crocea]|uniref:Uncharacterized protein n=1 Tax=Gordonia crocea TaxID=589162 RepID=A0A7I9UVL9_9ACTN|nr:hypothetical protein nbrc107697_13030 [Gordonia crocea]